MRGRASLAVALAIAFAGCTCQKKERVVATLDGPVVAKVSDVERTKLTIGAIGAAHAAGIIYPTLEGDRTCELEVTKPKKLVLDIGSDCLSTGYELAADPEGKRLALRPVKSPASDWRLLYFGSENRSFDAPRPVSGASPLAWGSVPSLDAELDAIYEEHPGPLALAEIRSLRGESGLADFLVKEAALVEPHHDDNPCLKTQSLSTWKAGFDGLPEEQRRRVARGLEPNLHAGAPPLLLLRAVLVANLDEPRIAAEVDALVDAGAKRSDAVPEDAFALVLLHLAAHDAKRAAALGCARLGASKDASMLSADARAAFVAIAQARSSCDAVAPLVERERERGYCRRDAWFEATDRHRPKPFPRTLAPATTGVERAKAIVRSTDAERRRFVCAGFDDGDLALTAAVRASNAAVAARALVPVERRAYAIVMPKAPRCVDLGVERAGTPCWVEAGAIFDSRLSCDPAQTSFLVSHEIDPVSFEPVGEARIDDAKRTLSVVRSKEPLSRLGATLLARDGGAREAGAKGAPPATPARSGARR